MWGKAAWLLLASEVKRMLVESWVIILILGIAGYMFVRRKRKTWAFGVFPLMLVPFINIVFGPIHRRLTYVEGVWVANSARIVVYIAAFLAASAWMCVWARRLPAGRSRLAYLVASIAFTALLVLVFILKLVFNLIIFR